MANALLITLIGMGLVFVVILLLWGLMALLVRLTAEKEAVVAPESETAAIEVEAPEASAQPEPAPGMDRKRRAAAAGVAAAIALQSSSRPAVKPAGSLSAWQIVHRAGQARQRAR